ncbi:MULTISPECIES: glycosyltransferase family 4 protein [Francisella]|uniref:Glycosyl transferase family 1 n=1 Tax=Francisella opportunistica TaxID=2016517 RepID=A0A345JQP3_9GAMM|nr:MULTISPECIES: glycosyltransferase family 4 protein [Francisella]APC91346.1 Glycosyl transferase, group 1 [Francisella sp. MA067296]AXH29639.1 glycosyl transferase family 1 [Francisella opportunistica]AXH31289.1 glycosyl transferase family 1 [Francisella opportunistica]AXH32936.1 glycosyl transferase family 1 [Francisella opportunistica]
MKILIVNTSDIQGGAARAAYRLHRSLLDANIDSQMLVQSKASDDYTVITENSRLRKYINKLRPIIDGLPVRKYKNRTKTLFSSSWFGFNNIATKINKINPDIIHLHWVNGGMLKIEDIARIKAPIVWSLHDMWAFTGGCHYDEECQGFLKGCGNCKVLRSSSQNDLSKKVFKRKQKTFNIKKDITIIGLSSWLNECSKNSTLLKTKIHINLPNPIDTDIFKPFDKDKARELWNLSTGKKLVLFGAMSATSDPRKGLKELNEGMTKMQQSKDIELVVLGSTKPQNAPNLGFKTHYLGSLADDVSLVTLYSAVDVTVVPSLQENLSNTIMESLSCGTPVVAFDIGGNNDMIDHKKNGYLAKPFDSQDLANGIEWILANDNYVSLCKNARYKVLRDFDSKVIAKKYIQLYKETLGR